MGPLHVRPDATPYTSAACAEWHSVVTVRGDRVEIVVDIGGGATRTYEVVATRAGRMVEITHGRGIVEVTEVTRSGTPVRTARFMSSRVLALVEHPADETGTAERTDRLRPTA